MKFMPRIDHLYVLPAPPLVVRPDHNNAGFGNGGQTAGHTQGDLQDRLSPDRASPGLYEC